MCAKVGKLEEMTQHTTVSEEIFTVSTYLKVVDSNVPSNFLSLCAHKIIIV